MTELANIPSNNEAQIGCACTGEHGKSTEIRIPIHIFIWPNGKADISTTEAVDAYREVGQIIRAFVPANAPVEVLV